MGEWSLPLLLSGLHDDVERRLATARQVFQHPLAKGDASENVWIELLQKYLPRRYEALKGFVVDSKGNFSDQIDVLIIDRQYTPFIFDYAEQKIVPAEGVYAAFEAKQTIDAGLVAYAQQKIATVRQLYRTNLPIPHAGGVTQPRPLVPIIGGILAFDSEWNPAFGEPLFKTLENADSESVLDIGCVASHGMFAVRRGTEKKYGVIRGKSPAATFLFELIATLQPRATVPMIDVRAYMDWLQS